jgi:endoglucanase
MKVASLLLTIFSTIPIISASNWYQSNGVLYKDGQPIVLHGVSWFGLETTDRAPSGLWTSNVKNGQTIGHSISWFMQKIKDLGFNALRIPLSPQGMSKDGNSYPTASWARQWDPSLTNGWAVLNSMLSEANKVGLYVVIDYQTCSDMMIGNNLPGSPTNCPGYTLNDWINDLNTLVGLSKVYPNIFAVDIFNEPHDIPWSTWQQYAQQALSQIYSTNPNIVYFIEGINGQVPNDPVWTCWGENLYNVGSQPVVPEGVPLNKIIYTPHVYDVCQNNYARSFGYLNGGQNTVIVGEFGYNSQDSGDTGTFIPNLMNYLQSAKINSFFYWCINANDSTLGYLVSSDSTWCTVSAEKIQRFRAYGINPQSYITSVNPPSLC